MPVYDYECDCCGEHLEQFRTPSFRDRLIECHACDKGIFRRIPSLPQPPKLNGPGFHQNDYGAKEGRG